MTNPVLVEVTRGGIAESVHRGAVAVLDADGAVALSIGDIDRPVFPRSAIKGLQALPLIESGAADRYGLTDAEIALACASHNGEERHVAVAASVLAKAGRDVAALECGAQMPLRGGAQIPLYKAGLQPTALHNNCSGKHAGFVCVACASGDDPAGYVGREHPTMRMVTEAVRDMTGASLGEAACGTDGCSIPTFAIPLKSLALAFARFGTGHGLGPQRGKAAARIRAAVAAEPFYVAGTERFDTKAMEALRARVFMKVGAEGVYCASIPELGLGVAIKCDDGTTRAAEVMMGAVIERFLKLSETEAAAMEPLTRQPLRNWNGIHVGDIIPAGPLAR
ncbi:MAG: asparaginase, partial [Beijerinckiaceae bacterium]